MRELVVLMSVQKYGLWRDAADITADLEAAGAKEQSTPNSPSKVRSCYWLHVLNFFFFVLVLVYQCTDINSVIIPLDDFGPHDLLCPS